jgi:hypothetical protein
MKGRTREDIYQEICRAEKDVCFLFFLWKLPNLELIGAVGELRLKLHLLVEQQTLLMLSRQIHNGVQSRRKKPLQLCYPTDPAALEEKTVAWREAACAAALSLFSLTQAVRLLSQKYFSGQEILFSGTAAILENAEAVLKCLAEVFNLGPRAADDIGIVLVDLREQAKSEGRAQAKRWVENAKAEALEKVGEQEAAEQVAKRQLARL